MGAGSDTPEEPGGRATPEEPGGRATPDEPGGRPGAGDGPGWRGLAVDALLEASVVGSFSRIGPAVRRRTAGWTELPSMAGRSVVVTGATSGLGLAAACRMAGLGASVCLVGRDPDRLESARRQVGAAGEAASDGATHSPRPGHAVPVEQADLGDLDQVRTLAARLAQRFERIDVLVHDAGALLRRYRTSPRGTELTVAVSLIAPFVLTEELLPLLRAASPSRVITMTSGGMYTQRFDLGTLEMSSGSYDGVVAYARAKRAQVVLTHEWQRRYGASGVDFHAVHPGWADTPGLAAGLPGFARLLRPLLRTPADGADTLVWLAAAPPRHPAGGRLWLDRRARGEHRLPWTRVPPSRREADGRALWEWLAARSRP